MKLIAANHNQSIQQIISEYSNKQEAIHVICESYGLRKRLQQAGIPSAGGDELFPSEGFPDLDAKAYYFAEEICRAATEISRFGEHVRSIHHFLFFFFEHTLFAREMANRLLDFYSPKHFIAADPLRFPDNFRDLHFSWRPMGNFAARLARRRGLVVEETSCVLAAHGSLYGLGRSVRSTWQGLFYKIRQSRYFREQYQKASEGRKRILLLAGVNHTIDLLRELADELSSLGWEVWIGSYEDLPANCPYSHFPIPLDLLFRRVRPDRRGKLSDELARKIRDILDDADLFELALPTLTFLLADHLRDVSWTKVWARRSLQGLSPSLILFTLPNLSPESPLLVESRSMGILSACLQHGPMSIPWSYLSTVDKHIVSSSDESDLLISASPAFAGRVKVLGTPKIIGRSREIVDRRVEGADCKILVLCDTHCVPVSTNVSELIGIVAQIVKIAGEFSKIQTTIRRHPIVPTGDLERSCVLPSGGQISLESRSLTNFEWYQFIGRFDYVMGDLCDPYELALALGIPTAYIGWGVATRLVERERKRAEFVLCDEKSVREFFRMAINCPHPTRSKCASGNYVGELADYLSKLASADS